MAVNIEEVKFFLKKFGLFDDKTLDTLHPSKINKCYMCNEKCGNIVRLTECDNNTRLCLNCIDSLYDNYCLNNDNSETLFKCLCCNKNILNYIIIE
jgi:hypothetical protein